MSEGRGSYISDGQSETRTVPRYILQAMSPSARGREQEQGGEKHSCQDDSVIGYRRADHFRDAGNDKRNGSENQPHNQRATAAVLGIFVGPGEQLRDQKNRRETEVEDKEDVPGRARPFVG